MIKKFLIIVFLFSISGRKLNSESFSFVLIPDTQKYTMKESYMKNFYSQIEWIINNSAKENIVFISHVGDVIESPPRLDLYRFKLNKICPIYRNINLLKTQKRWDRASKAMDRLEDNDNGIPYSIVPGNHDYDCTGVRKEKRSTKTFLKYFGPHRYSNKKWFLGSDSSKRNMAQKFEVNGKEYIHIGLEWLAPDYAIEFAQSIIINNPNIPVIITTHSHLEPGYPARLIPDFDGSDSNNSSGHNNSQQLFKKLIDPFPQIFLVLSGHITGDGFLESKTSLNQTVYQILANYSKDPQGGNGWLKLINFNPQDSKLNIQIISPTYKNFSEGINRSNDKTYNTIVETDINSLHKFLNSYNIKHYRQDQYLNFNEKYISAVDKNLYKSNLLENFLKRYFLKEKNIIINDKKNLTNGLLKFENIIGYSKSQIPPKTKILKAILTLTSEGKEKNNQNISVYKMLLKWDKESSLKEINERLDQTKEELNLSFTITKENMNGTNSFDVTENVQEWVDGQPNNGWLFVNDGNKNALWNFRSSEWDGIAERPMLTIIYKN